MSRIGVFIPSALRTAKQNLKCFVELAKETISLWKGFPGFNWDNATWKTPEFTIRFIKYEHRSLHAFCEVTPDAEFPEPFREFAKAYIRYTLSNRPRTHKKRLIVALRVLEAALRKISNNSDITEVSIRHFEIAESILDKDQFKDRSGIGAALTQLADFVFRNRLSSNDTSCWRHKFRGKNSDHSRAKSRKINGAEKLPDDDAILAIAEVFSNGYRVDQDDEDIFISCVTCMLMSAPMRISDYLYWPVEGFLDYRKDKFGVDQLNLPYISPKANMVSNKPIPTTMASLVAAAYERLRKCTEEGRKLALHYENTPDVFYPHPLLPNLPGDKILSVKELTNALGFTNFKHAESFVWVITGKYSLTGWTLDSIWKVILAQHRKLNPNFPYQVPVVSDIKPPKMSNSLMCFRHYQLTPHLSSSLFFLAPLNRDYYSKRVEGKGSAMSFFEKHNYSDLALKSHQFRHFLNTLWQEAGVPIEMITKWSDRASESQSTIYMHESTESRFNKIADSMNMLTVKTMEPITEKGYRDIVKGPVHVSQYGICSHDYTFSPCRKFHDCLSCSELVVCKGHKKFLKAIKEQRDKVSENVSVAERDVALGRRSATRWLDFNRELLTRLRLFVRKLEDPELPDGSAVQMLGTDFTHAKRVLDSKVEEGLIKSIPETEFSTAYSGDVAYCLRLLNEDDTDE